MSAPRATRLRSAQESTRALTGYQRLWYALICAALQTVRGRSPRSPQALADRAWLRGAHAPLLFADLCAGLSLDAEAVVAAITSPSVLHAPIRAQPWAQRRRMIVPDRICPECGEAFAPYLPNQRYCCSRHTHRAYCRRARARARCRIAVA